MTLYAKQQNCSSKAVEKNFLVTKRLLKKKQKMPYRQKVTESDRKATNFGLKLSNGTPKFPYKFKEIIS